MLPPDAFLLALSMTIRPILPRRAPPEPPAEKIDYGRELAAPLLPVIPDQRVWEVPDDLRDALGAPAPAAPAAGWSAAPTSLLLRGPGGALVHELGLGDFPEESGAPARTLRGGASADGQRAWYWQKAERRVDRGRVEAAPDARRALVLLGPRGQILFQDDAADAPPGLPPAVLARDGSVLLIADRGAGGWTVRALNPAGGELGAVVGAHRLEALDVSPDGRRALVAWSGLDEPLIVTVLDLKAGERLDLAGADLPPGPWSLGPGGAVLAAGRPVPHLP